MAQSKVVESESRPSYLAAGIAAALVFLLYVITLAPSTAMWDTSEYISAAYVLGIPHPPGNPFFVLLGHVMSMLPIAPSVAQRINIMAAACSALSAGVWFLVTERILEGWLPERWQRWVGASIAVLVGATAFTVWNQSVVNEKVYTVSLLFFAVVAWLTVRWCDDPDGQGILRPHFRDGKPRTGQAVEQEQRWPRYRAVFGVAEDPAVSEPDDLIKTSRPGQHVIHSIVQCRYSSGRRTQGPGGRRPAAALRIRAHRPAREGRCLQMRRLSPHLI